VEIFYTVHWISNVPCTKWVFYCEAYNLITCPGRSYVGIFLSRLYSCAGAGWFQSVIEHNHGESNSLSNTAVQVLYMSYN